MSETTNGDRREMDAAIKAVVVPALRAKGFAGSFPHFRRASARGMDLSRFSSIVMVVDLSSKSVVVRQKA